MSKSLDDLIEFILGQVALCGSQGATVTKILDSIDDFYASDPATCDESAGETASHNSRKATIDRPFQERVWKWLTRRGDVSIQEHREGNHLSLSEALDSGSQSSLAIGARSQQSVPAQSIVVATPERGNDSSHGFAVEKSSEPNLHVYVSEERMWLAICGHLPDFSLVLPLEFKLLSIIASAGESGVIQGDLIKISGQDKRSVPNRTKTLQVKGYIEKRRIQVRGSHTSLLLLRKFARTASGPAPNTSVVCSIKEDRDDSAVNFIDFTVLLPNLFEHLRKDKIITYKSLRHRLDMDQSKWVARSFSRLIRRLEESGHVERVRARSKDSAALKWFYPSVKYIRDPSEGELKRYVSTKLDLGQLIDETTHANVQDEDDEELAADEGAIVTQEPDPEEPLVEIERTTVQWNPDRQLTHTILDIIRQAGSEGITIQHIRDSATGIHLQRSIENMLQRFVIDFIASQPPHLRHLAIVRDVRMVWKTTRYVHYLYDDFKSLVQRGETAWEAIVQSREGAEENSDILGHGDERDTFGLPRTLQAIHQYREGRASIASVVAASKPKRVHLTKHDPVIVERDGRQALAFGYEITTPRKPRRDRQPPSSSRFSAVSDQPLAEPAALSPKISKAQKERVKPTRKPSNVTLGRPRKFLRGTEKYWQQQFAKISAKKREGNTTGRTGTMSNPDGLALFARRPPNFDETLVKAIKKGLPIPQEPDDICQEWVDMTCAVLSNDGQGSFVSPKCPVSRTATFSQIFVVKLPRLKTLNLTLQHHGSNKESVLTVADKSEATTLALSRSEPQRNQRSSPRSGSSNATLRHEVFERSPNGQLCGAEAHYNESGLYKNHLVNPNTASAVRGQPAGINDQETASQPAPVLLTQPEVLSSSAVASLAPLAERSLTSATQNGILPEPLLTPQPRKRGRPKKSMDAQKSPVRIANLRVPVTPQSQKPSRPRKLVVLKLKASLLAQADPSQSNDPGLPPGREIEPSAERLGEGVTTRSGRELPKPSFVAARPTLEPRKRKGESTTSKTQNKKRRKEKVSLALNDPALQPSVAVSPSKLPSMETARLQTTHEVTHEDAGQSALPISKNAEASAIPISFGMQQKGSPVATQTLLPDKEPHALDETEPNGAVLSEESYKKEAAPLKERLLGTQGGTVALTRRNIIMSVIEQCHGAVPDGPPLQFGFVTKWRNLGYHGMPDNRTIETTVRTLVATGKAKRLVFTSSIATKATQSKHSMLVRPDMLIAPVNTDQAVTTLRERMDANAPEPYFPEDLDWDQALKREKHRQVAGRKRGMADIDESLETVSDTIPAAVRFRSFQQQIALLKRRRTNQYQAALKESKDTNRRRKFMDSIPASRITETQQPLRLRPGVIQMRGPLRLSDKTREALRTYHPASGGVFNEFTKQVMLLPTSLADILRDGTRGPRPMPNTKSTLDYPLFCSEVDRVQRWESRRSDLFNIQSSDWRFINHHIADSFLQIDSSEWQLQFEGLTKFDDSGMEYDDKTDHSNTLVNFDFPTPEQLLSSKKDSLILPPHYSPLGRPKALRNMGSNVDPSLAKEPRVASRDLSSKATLVKKNAEKQRDKQAEEKRQAKAHKGQDKTETRQQRAEKRRQQKAEKREEKAEKKRQEKAEKKGQKELQKASSSKSRRKEISFSPRGPKKTRRPQFMRHLPASQVYRIAVVITVVRTLTGGIERQIDWPVVMRCLPNGDKDFIKERWKTMTNKYRHELDELSDMFSSKYLKAYERDEVPSVDFDNLHEHDWEGLVDWALKSLREPEVKDLPDLPSSRNDLEQHHSLHVEPSSNIIRSTFNFQSNVSVPAKELAMAATPFGTAYLPTPNHKGVSAANELTVAKTWHRALIIAGDTLDSRTAAAKFTRIPEEVHKSALHSLVKSHTLTRARQSQPEDLVRKPKKLVFNNKFDSVLGKQRVIEVGMLGRAAWFKTDVLDAKFAAGESVSYEPGVTVDGDMLAIINLAARGRVKLVPVNEPCDRYGLIRSYRTRDIPKEKFRFQVNIVPVEGAYVFGLPSAEATPPPPRGGVDDEMGLIPLWVDIHGRVDRDLWQTVVAACVGLIALRPGIGVKELAEMLMPALEVQDAEWVVQWLSEGGFVKRTAGGGWETGEWWWAVLSGDKGKGKAKETEDGTLAEGWKDLDRGREAEGMQTS
ncbi:MAG: hypothetical protein Q9160_003065 [Pyrenula sp. 1 TL-2023]